MMRFLIEFRLHGYAKRYAKWADARIRQEARRLGIRKLYQPRFVPHVSLFGQAETNDIRNVIREVERVGGKYTLVPFKLGGFDKFENPDGNWLYLKVEPSSILEQLRYELAQSLIKCERAILHTCRPYYLESKYKFHSSILKCHQRDKLKFEKLYKYAETKCNLEAFKQYEASVLSKLLNTIKRYGFGVKENDQSVNQHVLRITVMGRGRRIQAEYDLIQKKTLSRREALSKYWWQRTIEIFRELQNTPSEKEPQQVSSRSIYLIGDTHFDHENIIRYCHRPFSNVAKMNEVIINNWNATVGHDETIYFLGDWTFGRGHRPAKYWERQLKGNIISIRGSHDHGESGIQFRDFEQIHTEGYDFLLIHNPNRNDKYQTQEQKQKLENWHGWVIHSHVHNNNMDEYPFINGEKKTINVSVEVINYRPVSLKYLLSLGLDSIRRIANNRQHAGKMVNCKLYWKSERPSCGR